MIGGLFENHVSREHLSSTLPYYMDDLTWCVARADFAPKWMNIFYIFDIITWTIIIVVFILMGFILYIFARQHRKNDDRIVWSILNSFSLTINNFDYLQSNNFLYRLFIMVALFYGIHIGVAYRSALINMLTSPRYEPQVANIQTAVANNFTFKGNVNVLLFFDKEDNVSVNDSSIF